MRNETYSYDEVELMAIYENVLRIPNENMVTSWWGDMVEIKDKVVVNYWGTVLSREAVEPRMVDGIEMNSQTGIVMTDDDYNYTGVEVSVEEYLKNYREFENEYCEPMQNNSMTMGGM